jgi:hypothetical protein
MPANHSFWGDDDERLFPLGPQSTDSNPEQLVEQTESWSRTTPFQHGQLLAEHEVLKEELAAVTEDANSDPNSYETARNSAGIVRSYAIDFTARQSFGEEQARVTRRRRVLFPRSNEFLRQFFSLRVSPC